MALIMLLCCWAKGYHEPLYLISNMTSAEEACQLYGKRFRIQTFFSQTRKAEASICTNRTSPIRNASHAY